MAVTKVQKAELLEELKKKLKECSSVMFAHYIGMKVADVSELRRTLKGAKAEMKVGKKTLMQIATKECNLPALSDEMLSGPVACIFSFDDPLTGAQIAFKFAKDHPQVELIGGIFEGKLMSKDEASAFAKIPSRVVLLTMFAGMIRSPLQNFASICSSPLQSFARGLSEMAKKKNA